MNEYGSRQRGHLTESLDITVATKIHSKTLLLVKRAVIFVEDERVKQLAFVSLRYRLISFDILTFDTYL